MLRFILKRIGYGFLLLIGVITLVFFLFTVLPSDPARVMMGQRSDIATEEAIRKELGLDLPIGVQYLAYLNDLSPISWHKTQDTESFFYLNDRNYHYVKILSFDESSIVLKKPYLRRSYQSKRPVGEIIVEAFPKTLLLAIVAIPINPYLRQLDGFPVVVGYLGTVHKGVLPVSRTDVVGVVHS